jgi:hypothetical protein
MALPVPSALVERSFARLEETLRGVNEPIWTLGQLVLKARWQGLRGDHAQVRSLLLQALAVPCEEGTGFLLPQLAEACIAGGDAVAAGGYLRRYREEEGDSSVRVPGVGCRLARLEGRVDEALELARQAAFESEGRGPQQRREGLQLLAEALLAVGETECARQELGRLLRLRHSESRHDRYALLRLCGDYHLACARREGGLPPVDPDRRPLGAPAAVSPAGPAVRRQLRLAALGYRRAQAVGGAIDDQLESSLRRRTLRGRFGHLEAVRRRLAAAGGATVPAGE